MHELFIVGRQITTMPVWTSTIAHIDWIEFTPVTAASVTAGADSAATLSVRVKDPRVMGLKRNDVLESDVAG